MHDMAWSCKCTMFYASSDEVPNAVYTRGGKRNQNDNKYLITISGECWLGAYIYFLYTYVYSHNFNYDG